MSKTILITRPREQAEDFARDLHALGFQTIIEPMLEIHPLPYNAPDLMSYDGLIFTSANAVRPLKTDLPAYVVGAQTRAAAQKAGFQNITSATGNAKALSVLLDKNKTYLHFCGADKAFEFDDNVHPLVIYEAHKTEKLSPQTIDSIKNKSIHIATFFSARTARNFAALALEHGLTPHLESINCLSISEDVLKCVRACGWSNTYIATQPDRQGMMKTLQKMDSTMSNSKAFSNAGEVIERFGGIRPMASKTNIPVTTIQGWKKRGTIPGTRTEEIIGIARTYNIDLEDVTGPATVESFIANENQPHEVPLTAQSYALETTIENNRIQALEQKLIDMEKRATLKSAIITGLLVLIAAIALIAIFWPSATGFHSETERRAALEQKLAEEQPRPGVLTESLKQNFADFKLQAQSVTNEVLAGGQAIIAQTPFQIDALMARFNDLKQSVSGEQQLDTAVQELNTYIASLQSAQTQEELNAALAAARQQGTALAQTLEGVPQPDLKAAAMLLAMTQFRASLGRNNQPFEDDFTVLKTLAGPENAELQASLDALAPYAQSGVLTPAGLQSEFQTLTGDIVVASLQGEDVSVQERARARLNELIELQKSGELVTGTETQATLARTNNLLGQGNIENALAELKTLNGGALEAAMPFIGKMQATLNAQHTQRLLAQFSGH